MQRCVTLTEFYRLAEVRERARKLAAVSRVTIVIICHYTGCAKILAASFRRAAENYADAHEDVRLHAIRAVVRGETFNWGIYCRCLIKMRIFIIWKKYVKVKLNSVD